MSSLHRDPARAVLAALSVVLAFGCGGDDEPEPAGPTTDATHDVAAPPTDEGAPGDEAPAPDPGAPEETGEPDVQADVPDVPIDPLAYPPPRKAVITLDGQALFPAKLDGKGPYLLVVDTGAMATTIQEELLRDIEEGGLGKVGQATIDFGYGVVVEDHKAFAADLSVAADHVGELHGLIGQDLFGSWYFGIDYRASEVTIAPTLPVEPPTGFALTDAVDVPYQLNTALPIVQVDVGGETFGLIADTGSGVTIVPESVVPPEVMAKGLGGYVWFTQKGSEPGTIVRLPSLKIGGYEVKGTWAVVVPEDHHMKPIFDITDSKGFLGFPVYRQFYVGVAGAESRYVFYPYQNLDHVPQDEWTQVGVGIKRSEGKVEVVMVYDPSDALAKGVEPGDIITKVDDVTLSADMPIDEVRMLLHGKAGETRACAIEGKATLDLSVDDLLPPL